ncbi:MAG: hypothetical protein JETCAE02_19990 [Anaerolineaceae bacterium]|nr:hypothetical protein [Anaerolineae bacterium]MBL1171386.1 hypothetical protein [Chloroflexota bacterium]MCL4823250.1 hypothetical protein [Anaerolineales bacterium]MDL1924665.1 hypothetical protein [Anaerolineae bacterium AMX1]GJQ39587.1 MAG: hypothetical protein JETCAE02_19990 [Anaerolineaceae bacterium]
MTDTFPCPACGAPNEPEAGRAQMTCSYCGANLTIPASMRRDAPPKAEKTPKVDAPAPRQEMDASELLRQAQPVVTKAWNAFALWTWVRRALPACLVAALIALCACVILGALPFITNR